MKHTLVFVVGAVLVLVLATASVSCRRASAAVVVVVTAGCAHPFAAAAFLAGSVVGAYRTTEKQRL
jgi:hypothetical protein